MEKLVYREYAKALSEDEFDMWFPKEDGVRPGLPVDIDEPPNSRSRD